MYLAMTRHVGQFLVLLTLPVAAGTAGKFQEKVGTGGEEGGVVWVGVLYSLYITTPPPTKTKDDGPANKTPTPLPLKKTMALMPETVAKLHALYRLLTVAGVALTPWLEPAARLAHEMRGQELRGGK